MVPSLCTRRACPAGGHTAEMLRLVTSMDRAVYNPRVYVSAATDTMSQYKARAYEEKAAEDDVGWVGGESHIALAHTHTHTHRRTHTAQAH